MNFLKRFFRKRRRVEMIPAEALSDAELRSAFAVVAKHPLWRGFMHLLDESLAAKLSDAVDGESHGEASAVERGEAKALLEFKARVLEVREHAMRGQPE